MRSQDTDRPDLREPLNRCFACVDHVVDTGQIASWLEAIEESRCPFPHGSRYTSAEIHQTSAFGITEPNGRVLINGCLFRTFIRRRSTRPFLRGRDRERERECVCVCWGGGYLAESRFASGVYIYSSLWFGWSASVRRNFLENNVPRNWTKKYCWVLVRFKHFRWQVSKPAKPLEPQVPSRVSSLVNWLVL